MEGLADELHQVLKHLIRRGDHSGAGLIATLGDNHVTKLPGQIDIGAFQVAALYCAMAP